MVNATFVVMKMTIHFHVAKKNKGGEREDNWKIEKREEKVN